MIASFLVASLEFLIITAPRETEGCLLSPLGYVARKAAGGGGAEGLDYRGKRFFEGRIKAGEWSKRGDQTIKGGDSETELV